MATQVTLPAELNDFDPQVRRAALAKLPPAGVPAKPLQVNMHAHTFYSYNGYDASPSMVVATAARDGWYAAGSCDFDVLDAMDEFLEAGDVLGVRTTVNLESRVFFSEYAEHEINSPGEPGVYYFMGGGFVKTPPTGSAGERALKDMRSSAESRNRALLDRVNDYLDTLTLDYDKDVLPFTPKGNATERHMLAALHGKSRAEFPAAAEFAAYWSTKLGCDEGTAAGLWDNPMAFGDLARSKLMKAGGPGYVKPTKDTFPPLEDVIAMIKSADAVPMGCYLDGTRSGEADIETQLECLVSKGIAAYNIIPDRNWNIKDPETRDRFVKLFHECVAVCDKLHLPINVGTELNKYGQRWIDDFTADAMAKCAASFIKGADVMVGHTRALRYADYSYSGTKAAAEFNGNTAAKNDVFAAIGRLPVPGPATRDALAAAEPDAAYAKLRDAAKSGAW